MRIIIANKTVIFIGMKGEDNATQVRFPIARQWRETYGDGVFALAFQRPTESSPYACTVTEDENGNVCWDITNTEVAKVGNGQAELLYYVDGNIAKSATYITTSVDSITAVEGDPPEPWESWIDQVIEAGTTAVQAATDASESAADALQSKQNAEGSATDAATAKTAAESAQQAAEGAADRAEDAQTAAEQSARDASGSAESAETAQTAAEEAQGKAETARDQAEGYAESASGSASDAAAEADAASESAEQAQASAEAAQSWAENANDSQDAAVHAAGQAGSYASTAQQAAIAAVQSASKIADLTVTAHGLPTGSDPTATKTDPGSGQPYNIDFGIPKGETGDCNFATFEIDPRTGILYANWTQDNHEIQFSLNRPYLEVEIQ